ncbi:hypothetical protein GCM10010923_02510 [Blastomonas marina]|uniref:Uncharacterized protein n=1 Tax=Blastomonas marina TaxID=1867408 RepID=A0ABQ1F3Q5_9SPHN|nr:hypothetical protein [Blastomonas marina]GFZ97939.1 hypothetical protein GCM10010923_02510 [Blastomonas marina]
MTDVEDIETKNRFPWLLVLAALAVLALIWWLTAGDTDTELSEEQIETAQEITPDELEADTVDATNLEEATPPDVVVEAEEPFDGDATIAEPVDEALEREE